MDCKILRQYSLIIDPSIETKKQKIDFLKVLDKETPLSNLWTTLQAKILVFGNFQIALGQWM